MLIHAQSDVHFAVLLETGWKKRRNSEARGGVNGLLRTGFQQPHHRGPYPRVSQFSLPKRSSDDLVRVKIRPNALGKDTFTATRYYGQVNVSAWIPCRIPPMPIPFTSMSKIADKSPTIFSM